jgi:inosose dehydratase
MPSFTFSRRGLLGGASAALVGNVALQPRPVRAQQRPREYGPFRMGIQSYSLRGYPLDAALRHTRDLGLRFWEAFNAHLPLSDDVGQVAANLARLEAAGVRVLAYGVLGFGGDAAANRRTFQQAKVLGIPVISADPAPESLDQLSELVEEFRIKIAIHNHGPGSRYDKLADVQKALEGRPTRMGACVDTGHFLRSGEDPVKVIEALGERVHGVHLKDVKDGKTFTVLGKGDLNTRGVLSALQGLRYREVLALEYEENPSNPLAEIRECLDVVKAAVAAL